MIFSLLFQLCKAFGAEIEKADNKWHIDGLGVGGLDEPEKVLDLGNSGTGVRLLLGVAAGNPITSFFSGDESLSRRPMERVLKPLEMMGASFTSRSGGLLPLACRRSPDFTAHRLLASGSFGSSEVSNLTSWSQHSGKNCCKRAHANARPYRENAQTIWIRDKHRNW